MQFYPQIGKTNNYPGSSVQGASPAGYGAEPREQKMQYKCCERTENQLKIVTTGSAYLKQYPGDYHADSANEHWRSFKAACQDAVVNIPAQVMQLFGAPQDGTPTKQLALWNGFEGLLGLPSLVTPVELRYGLQSRA